MSEYLTVIAEVQAKPGHEEAVRDGRLALVKPTHAEAGCMSYDLHESIDEKGLFFFYENWTGEQALQQHLATPHIQAMMAQSEQLLARPVSIKLCRRLNQPKNVLLGK